MLRNDKIHFNNNKLQKYIKVSKGKVSTIDKIY